MTEQEASSGQAFKPIQHYTIIYCIQSGFDKVLNLEEEQDCKEVARAVIANGNPAIAKAIQEKYDKLIGIINGAFGTRFALSYRVVNLTPKEYYDQVGDIYHLNYLLRKMLKQTYRDSQKCKMSNYEKMLFTKEFDRQEALATLQVRFVISEQRLITQ